LSTADIALCPDADFTRSVSTENSAILNESDFAARTSRRNRRTHAGVAAADHDEVITIADRWGLRQSEQSPSPLRQNLRRVRRRLIFRREINGITPAVESGEVTQGEPHRDWSVLGTLDRDGSPLLPVPIGPLGAE